MVNKLIHVLGFSLIWNKHYETVLKTQKVCQSWAAWSKKFLRCSRSYIEKTFCETCSRLANPASLGVRFHNVCSIGLGIFEKSMKIIKDTIKVSELSEMSKKMFGDLVKAVVDIEKGIMVVDAPLHSDLMEYLIESEDSELKNLWGINFYSQMPEEHFIEFDSMINLKPGLGNRTRGIESEVVKEKIRQIAGKLIKK